MVSVFGNNIDKVFTVGQSVEAIYTGGVKVWPSSSPEPTPGEYYIKWWPKSLSGSFIIGDEARWLQDYNGYYSGPFISSRVFLISNLSTRYVKTIDMSAFASTGIVGIETNLECIASVAFQSCHSLRYVRASNVICIDRYAFIDCENLYSVELPEFYIAHPGVFSGCSHLGFVDLPKLSKLHPNMFKNCTNLYEVSVPKCRVIGEDWPAVFEGCYNLKSLYLPICSRIDEYGLASCGLETLVLGSTSVVSVGESFLKSTGITSSTGSIYVPLSLVSEYKSASGWSYFSRIIYPIPHE